MVVDFYGVFFFNVWIFCEFDGEFMDFECCFLVGEFYWKEFYERFVFYDFFKNDVFFFKFFC